MARVVELNESARPFETPGHALGIKHSSLVLKAHTHALGHRDAAAFEDTAEHSAHIARGPATILPGHLIILIAPVPLLAAVHAGESGDQSRERLLLHKVQRLLAIAVKDPLAIHKLLPVLVVGFVERGQVRGEWRRIGCLHDWRGRTEVVKAP